MVSEYPEIVYKYRTWSNENHKRILLNNEVFLSPPNDFNDPFDCRIPTNYHLLEENEMEDYITQLIKKHKPSLTTESEIDSEKEYLRLKFANRDKLQKDNEVIEFEGFNERVGVLSLSARWDSILMWSHYSENHKGFCIGFKEESLRQSGLFGKGGTVFYGDDFPKIKPNPNFDITMRDSFLKTHTKSLDWQYEEEYRIVTLSYPEPLNRVVNIPKNFIAEIILGIEISLIHRSEILNEAKMRSIPTFQAKKVPFKFKIDRERLL